MEQKTIHIEAKRLQQKVDHEQLRQLFQQKILNDDGSFKSLICSDIGVTDEYFDFLQSAYLLMNSHPDATEFRNELEKFISNRVHSDTMHIPYKLKDNLCKGKDLLAEGEIIREQFIREYFRAVIKSVENDVYLNTFTVFFPVLCPEFCETEAENDEADMKSTRCAPSKCSIF